ncbi:F5/8 type C domain protein [Marvinbryantia formatexigens DSM 14469]|uniref:F5/8 type C domain protein n=2 Tax=Marvinbryantia TaxID=248744 RepID=C6LI24_9FIRM|nr:discoidin domain-containing protein [Marvinbryantia formatexigens]EET59679.1 F5/8 type C domain protein [Marvinbryantia formatexigens DSM 14469]UWO26664.1 discoidin domain-containing protein [Marvinbryantia formatexigens DSM 14469]SDG45165.1 PKD domain-containing protein [Marvinbryantia formatexigens]
MVIPVNELLTEGEGVTVSMEWPDNSLPKAGLTASQTLVGPGSTVTFTSSCSQNTESVAWSMPGAGEETAEGETVSVIYENEGVYDVTVTAKNSSGEEEKTFSGLIVVSAELEKDGALTLLSQGKEVEATAYVNDNEAPPFAVDGDVTKKWCATGTPPHELTIDLGEEAAVSQVKISHAEAGGESADMNTKAYTILVSSDGLSFNEVASVTKNTKGETLDTFAPVNARYVKLSVVKPTQGSDTAARIYEVEVYGTETTLDAASETE